MNDPQAKCQKIVMLNFIQPKPIKTYPQMASRTNPF